MSSSEKIKLIIDAALDGPLPKALVGIGDTANGKLDVIVRFAYIAGMKRALEIIEDYEQDQRDAEAEKKFTQPINPDPVTKISKELREKK
jgi:hypothetical protein